MDIKTQGIKYAGSKIKLLPYILKIIKNIPGIKNILDGFSGTTRVSQALVSNGYFVHSNDTSVYSKVFSNCYLKSNDKPDSYYQSIIDELNSLKAKDGWFSQTYNGDFVSNKAPFSRENLQKLDAIREHIETLSLSEIDKDVLLSSLMLGLDKVCNTLGHFASYLRVPAARAYKPLFLNVPNRDLNIITLEKNVVSKEDILSDYFLDKHFDLAYLDPPYGSNNNKMPSSRVIYSVYYHFWNSVCLNDKPLVFGKSGRRLDTKVLRKNSNNTNNKVISPFEDFTKNSNGEYIAEKAIEAMLKRINAKYILFSYSNMSRVPIDSIHKIFSRNGDLISVNEINSKKNVMSAMRWTNEWVNRNEQGLKEYLFLLKKK